MNDLIIKGQKAKQAAEMLADQSSEAKNRALILISNHLLEEKHAILEANKNDIHRGQKNGMTSALIDRLRLDDTRIKEIADALIQLTHLEDPIGQVIDQWERPNGLKLKKVRVPLGVVGMIYEARPNVTVDATGLCLKTGNAILLRGSSSAIETNKVIVNVIHQALEKSDLPADAVQLVEDIRRETVDDMLKLTKFLDVVIPRGSAAFIQHVTRHSIVPIIETGAGNCHVYIDKSADLDMTLKIAINAKTDRPSVCNACETILVHKEWAEINLKQLIEALQKNKVHIHGDTLVQAVASEITPATEEDWLKEYLSFDVALKVVDNVNEAIQHINTYGTKHSEVIVSSTPEHIDVFFSKVDAAVVYHNASSRFTDGFEFGYGAEVGISTQKLHVRGPMGLPALTTSKIHVKGTGQVK